MHHAAARSSVVKLRDCTLLRFVAIIEESAEVSRLKSYAIQKGREARNKRKR